MYLIISWGSSTSSLHILHPPPHLVVASGSKERSDAPPNLEACGVGATRGRPPHTYMTIHIDGAPQLQVNGA